MRVPNSWMRRYWWLLVSALAGAAGLGVFLALWLGDGGQYVPPVRARVYSAFSACLLTGPRGLADPQAMPVWAGLQDASLATRAKVTYLTVAGPATVGNAVPYLGSLVARHCDVIVAVGTTQTAAVRADSGRFRGVRFVEIGSAMARPNVTVVPARPAAAVRSRVASVVEAAAG
jgi:hypothetical protein